LRSVASTLRVRILADALSRRIGSRGPLGIAPPLRKMVISQ
jgi:hypothetical protein